MRRTAAWLIAFAIASPAFAQGKSQGKGHGNGAPSENALAPVASIAPSITATPLAWIDDATLLDAGAVAVSIAISHWAGNGIGETDIPVVDAAIGVSSRMQLSASVPRVLGSQDATGITGGLGTSYVSAKIQIAENKSGTLKATLAPTLQLLGDGVLAALGPTKNRARVGIPASVEFDSGRLRVFGGGGYFSPGLWFTGGAVSVHTTPRSFVTVGLSRAWRTADGADIPLADRDRKELSGGVTYVLVPHVNVFGSVATTIATLDENGAGKTISAGVSFVR